MQTDEAGFRGTELNNLNEERQDLMDLGVLLGLNENHQLGWWFQKAYSYKYVIKTPFDLLSKTCGLATARSSKSKGGHNG